MGKLKKQLKRTAVSIFILQITILWHAALFAQSKLQIAIPLDGYPDWIAPGKSFSINALGYDASTRIFVQVGDHPDNRFEAVNQAPGNWKLTFGFIWGPAGRTTVKVQSYNYNAGGAKTDSASIQFERVHDPIPYLINLAPLPARTAGKVLIHIRAFDNAPLKELRLTHNAIVGNYTAVFKDSIYTELDLGKPLRPTLVSFTFSAIDSAGQKFDLYGATTVDTTLGVPQPPAIASVPGTIKNINSRGIGFQPAGKTQGAWYDLESNTTTELPALNSVEHVFGTANGIFVVARKPELSPDLSNDLLLLEYDGTLKNPYAAKILSWNAAWDKLVAQVINADGRHFVEISLNGTHRFFPTDRTSGDIRVLSNGGFVHAERSPSIIPDNTAPSVGTFRFTYFLNGTAVSTESTTGDAANNQLNMHSDGTFDKAVFRLQGIHWAWDALSNTKTQLPAGYQFDRIKNGRIIGVEYFRSGLSGYGTKYAILKADATWEPWIQLFSAGTLSYPTLDFDNFVMMNTDTYYGINIRREVIFVDGSPQIIETRFIARYWTPPNFYTDNQRHTFFARGDFLIDHAGRSFAVQQSADSATIYPLDGKVALSISEPSIPGSREVPGSFDIAPVYPNPFNGSAVVTVTTRQAGVAVVTVHDITGRQLAVLKNGLMTQGAHNLRISSDGMATGVYFVKMQMAGQVSVRKFTVIR